MKLALLLASLAACGHVVSYDDDDGGGSDDAPPRPDAGSTARCDPAKPFTTPTLVPNVNTADSEISFALTRDELTAFVNHAVESPSYGASMLATTRTSTAVPFPTPRETDTEQLNLGDGSEFLPFPTHDALTLYFSRQVDDSSPLRVVASSRDSAAMPFPQFEAVVQVDGVLLSSTVVVASADDQHLYWSDPQLRHLRTATRADFPDVFVGEREASTVPMQNPVLSLDELTVYYSDGAETDILAATRPDLDTPFGVGVPVANVNSPENDAPTYVTSDGCVLYLKSNRAGSIGGIDIWEARRPR
jgi:hypothetical protein